MEPMNGRTGFGEQQRQQLQMLGQAPTRRVPPPPPEPAKRGDAPGTGPDRLPGVFEFNDQVVMAGHWSEDYIVTVGNDENDVVTVVKDCGCAAVPVRVHAVDLTHRWHREHPDG